MNDSGNSQNINSNNWQYNDDIRMAISLVASVVVSFCLGMICRAHIQCIRQRGIDARNLANVNNVNLNDINIANNPRNENHFSQLSTHNLVNPSENQSENRVVRPLENIRRNPNANNISNFNL